MAQSLRTNADGQTSVDRLLAVLTHLAHRPGEHGVRAISGALGLSPSTTFRLLEALVRAGFARHDEATGKYAIGLQAVRLGLAAMEAFDLTAVVPPYLRALTAETGETSFLATLDEGEMVYLLKEEGRRAIRTTAALGSRRPTHCTGLGKAFLAALPFTEADVVIKTKGMPVLTPRTITEPERLWGDLAETRLRGYSIDREESEEGLWCLAAPIRDYTGNVVAAISLAGPIGRLQPNEERYGRRIVTTALEISQVLGYAPRQPAVGSSAQPNRDGEP